MDRPMFMLVLLSFLGTSLAKPRSSASKCGYESCTQAEAGVLNVHIVPHTHDDVGWLKTVDQYYYGSKNYIQIAGVQYILDSVVNELWADPKKRFIYVETAFFWKWWVRQSEEVQNKVHTLVNEGRLQFVGGAWSMNDEAATHYQSTIDQFTWGLRKLNDTFGYCGIPKVGWQIDPFGHSREFASLLAGMGYDGLFLGRIDYQDKTERKFKKTMEMLWRGDDSLGKSSDLFTGILFNTYSPPPGFCFDMLCKDEPIIDDQNSPMYNVDQKIRMFLHFSIEQSKVYRTNNIIMTMGGDFHYQDTHYWFSSLDKLIEYTNLKAAKEGMKIKLFYSTPDCYLKAVKDANPTLPVKQDDFFPYASDPTAFWTGYFTSRPAVKYFEKQGNAYLQMFKQLQLTAGLPEHNDFVLDEMRSAMGIMQHHDAITGTEKTHVAADYERILNQAIEDGLIIPRQAINKLMQRTNNPINSFGFERCQFNISQCAASENSDNFVVTIYNPLGWKLKTYPVRIPVLEGNYEVYAPNGDKIMTQIVEIPDFVQNIPERKSKATHELVFLAENIKPVGYKNFFVVKMKKEVKRNTDTVQNNFYRDFNEKRKKEFYENVNDYWKSVKDQNYLEVKDLEDGVVTPQFDFNKPKDTYKYTQPNLETTGMLISDKFRKNDGSVKRNDLYEKRALPMLNDDEMRMLGDDPTVITMSDDGLVNTHTTKLMYYPACSGDNRSTKNRSSGAYIFRPNATEATSYNENMSRVINGPIVFEKHHKLSEYVYMTELEYPQVRYREKVYTVGPIPVGDDLGKEVIVRHITGLNTDDSFYTDSNGRQLLLRIKDKRPTWNLSLEEPVPGNYYPVTTEISLKDGDKLFNIYPDRPCGASSLKNGEVELMLHRRLLHDDAFGVDEALNETANGHGLVARIKHREQEIEKADADYLKNPLEVHLEPIVFISDAKDLKPDEFLKMQNCFGGLSDSLPDGLHLLTLEPWRENQLLLRLENYFEKSFDSTRKEVDLASLFRTLKVKAIKETTLAANQWLEEREQWVWNKEAKFYKSFNSHYSGICDELADDVDVNNNIDGFRIKLEPKQIRTFVVDYDLVCGAFKGL